MKSTMAFKIHEEISFFIIDSGFVIRLIQLVCKLNSLSWVVKERIQKIREIFVLLLYNVFLESTSLFCYFLQFSWIKGLL